MPPLQACCSLCSHKFEDGDAAVRVSYGTVKAIEGLSKPVYYFDPDHGYELVCQQCANEQGIAGL